MLLSNRILAFDQSSQITGYFVCESESYVSHGKIDLHKDKDTDHRIQTMEASIFDLIDQCRPDTVVIEDTVLQRSPATLRMLAQLQGAIMGYCFAAGIPVHTLYPTTWRKTLGMKQGSKIKREELKQQAIDYVRNKYKIDVSSDEADAICIGLAYCELAKENLNVED